MKYRSYHKEIQKCTAQILDVFDEIYIDRRTPDDVVQKLIKVPCVYGPRSRILKSLENRGNNVSLPLIRISISSVSRDASRAIDIHSGLQRQHGTYDNAKNSGVPMTIRYGMDVIGKFQEDVDQVVSNFVPFFNPDIYVVVPHPYTAALNLKSQVVWNGDFSMDYGSETDRNSPHRVVASTEFTVKTWLFPGLEGTTETSGRIETISAGFHPVPRTMSYDEYIANYLSGYVSGEAYDLLTITG